MNVRVVHRVDEMQSLGEQTRLSGKTIGLVPTMGFFHEGHLELMRIARNLADRVVVSLFVNPTQFGENEDLAAYPRDLERDLAGAEAAGVDLLFLPSVEEMYPEGFQTAVHVDRLTRGLCGPFRPGHFDGVATVVAKLFHIVKPHVAVFGQKDYQQLAVISRMVQDLNMDVRIVGAPTVREPDGLAMSSRNLYLSPEERKAALCLSESLNLAQALVDAGERDGDTIRSAVETHIQRAPFTRIEYVTLCHPDTLEELKTIEQEALLALAVFVGRARLIDNRIIDGVAKSPKA
jgi:pantoate--beta-alanine ligase